ncbi:MAG: hypothetical protein KA984_04805 [Candidatus Cloacimonetes bacterium]|nr:hypothetical protein [Candidatus Cloacimonadota bacterium]
MHKLGKHLFWDADLSRLSLDEHAGYIIPRVMDYGSWDDVRFVFSYYPKETLKQILLSAPSLQIRTIHFFAHYFELPLQSFNSYQKLQKAVWKG